MLNANYLLAAGQARLPVPHGDRCMHEFVASAPEPGRANEASAPWTSASGCSTYGFHAPTVYFPLIVPEALMIEPTETESRETLDAFAEAMLAIAAEDPEILHEAPVSTPVSRPDEVRAVRDPGLEVDRRTPIGASDASS